LYIKAVGRAFPPNYYEQDVLVAALRAHWGQRHHNLDRLERLHRNVAVGGRHLALPLEDYADLQPWGKANRAWIRVGLDVGEAAVRDALSQAQLDLERVGAFFFTTVTGVATPSLDARLFNRLSMPPGIKRIPIFGLGCLAGAAGVARAADYVKAFPDQAAILLSVELCSLTMQQADLSIPNIISTGLFGDGAACAVVLGEDLAKERTRAQKPTATSATYLGPRVLATRSVFYPDTEDVMGWDISEEGFKIVLSAAVPEVARTRLAGDVDAFLDSHDLGRQDIGSWVCHPGGPKVLEALQEALALPDDALELTWNSLREVGNLSSTSVLLVLRETLVSRRPPAGTLGLMVAMGPGFCSELVLLEW